MKNSILVSALFVGALATAQSKAAEPTDIRSSHVIQDELIGSYRGYAFDLSEDRERKDEAATAEMLRRQLDLVEQVGFSPKVLRFLHKIPILASEMACLDESAAAACYGSALPPRESSGITTWDNEKHQWTNADAVELGAETVGVVMLRPNMMRYSEDPVILHEFLHAYHAKLMPEGFENKGVLKYYAEAQSHFDKEAYVVKNNREFFAVTASIFLAGKDAVHEPYTRSKLKQLMPNYYGYLVGVFGFDPEMPNAIPVASAN